MTFGKDNPMVLKITRICLLAAVLGVVAAPTPAAAGSDKSDAFEGIWTEDLERESGRADLSKERLEQIIEAASQGKADEEKRLRKLYADDQPKFWDEVRAFFHRNRPPGSRGPERPGPRGSGGWRERSQKRHDDLLALIKEHRPELALELAGLRESDPDKYYKEFSAQRRIWGQVLDDLNRGAKRLAALLIEDIGLVEERDALLREIHCADETRRAKLIEELEVVVGKRFDLILKKKKLQYMELRRRLKRLQEQLERKQQELEELTGSKKQAITTRLDKLVPKEKDESN
jgi:hypothetical protein